MCERVQSKVASEGVVATSVEQWVVTSAYVDVARIDAIAICWQWGGIQARAELIVYAQVV